MQHTTTRGTMASALPRIAPRRTPLPGAARAGLLALLIVFGAVLSAAGAARAATDNADAKQVWQLLDYVGVDYAGAVADGTIISAAEYSEMREFARTAHERIAHLPPTAAQPALVAQAQQLVVAIDAKAAVPEVAQAARALADGLVAAYAITIAPHAAPDAARGATLYQAHCAGCHGVTGRADTALAATLDPSPIAFTDAQRARERSVFGLYQAISQGLAGTSMTSFAALPEADRWALAFHVGQLAYSDAQRAQGKALWQKTASLHVELPDLAALTGRSEAQLATTLGDRDAQALTAYLRADPAAVATSKGAMSTLALARSRIDESLAAYQREDAAAAKSLALSAYLDGFEPVEPAVGVRDAALLVEVEKAMGEYRTRLAAGAPVAAVAEQAQVLQRLFGRAEVVLTGSTMGATAAFFGSFTILVREGLEALLIVIAMIAFLRKAERRDMLRYVHAGWLGALGAGVLTWGVATYAVSISGAGRELTEGFSSLFAAIVLLSVGIWMHQKSLAGRWQQYVRDKLSAALTRRSAWFLFALSFVVVYREVFETILFYIALWNQDNGAALLSGLLAGVVVLVLVATLMLRYSRRLPIAKFFSWSSLLIAVLAVVLAGKGVAALQEAGWLGIQPVDIPRVTLLGIYPSLQPLLAQAFVLVVAVLGFVFNTRTRPLPAVARAEQ